MTSPPSRSARAPRALLLLLLLACLPLLPACASDEALVAQLAPPVNSLCPRMGGEVQEFAGTTLWKGRVIGFCCPPCRPEFEALSEAEQAAALAGVGVPVD